MEDSVHWIYLRNRIDALEGRVAVLEAGHVTTVTARPAAPPPPPAPGPFACAPAPLTTPHPPVPPNSPDADAPLPPATLFAFPLFPALPING